MRYNNIDNALYKKISKEVFKGIKNKNIISVSVDGKHTIIVMKFTHSQFWDIDYCYKITLRDNIKDEAITQYQTEGKSKQQLGFIIRCAIRTYQEKVGA